MHTALAAFLLTALAALALAQAPAAPAQAPPSAPALNQPPSAPWEGAMEAARKAYEQGRYEEAEKQLK